MTPSVDAIRRSVDQTWRRIESAGGDPDRVRLVAVTKGHPPEVAVAASAAGLIDLGESRAQELEVKAGLAAGDVRWHFVGRIQRNKVRKIAEAVHLWHGVDRAAAGAEIAARAPGAAVLVQVNTTAEPQKAGCAPETTAALVAELLALGLDVRGLTTIGPVGSPEEARPAFRALIGLAEALGLPERSMGMSADLEVAVAEGATIVRVGTALFGPRPVVTDV